MIEEQGGEGSKRLISEISSIDGEHFYCNCLEIRNWPRIELESRGFLIEVLPGVVVRLGGLTLLLFTLFSTILFLISKLGAYSFILPIRPWYGATKILIFFYYQKNNNIIKKQFRNTKQDPIKKKKII